jgi:hypothetical protein
MDKFAGAFQNLNMKYYKIEHDANNLGAVPQDKAVIGNYFAIEHPDTINRAKHRQPIGNLLLPEGIQLYPRSKFTDLLRLVHITYPLWVISARFVDLLSKFQIEQPEVFGPLPVMNTKKQEDYYVFGATRRFPEYVCYDALEATLSRWDGANKREFVLNNVQDYLAIANLPKDDEAIYFKEGYRPRLNSKIIQHDLFLLPPYFRIIKYIASERLVEAIVSAKLTGMVFEELETC